MTGDFTVTLEAQDERLLVLLALPGCEPVQIGSVSWDERIRMWTSEAGHTEHSPQTAAFKLAAHELEERDWSLLQACR
jgi:hypothetical protein